MDKLLDQLEIKVQQQARELKKKDMSAFIQNIKETELLLQQMKELQNKGNQLSCKDKEYLSEILAVMQLNQKQFGENLAQVKQQLKIIRKSKNQTTYYSLYDGYIPNTFEG